MNSFAGMESFGCFESVSFSLLEACRKYGTRISFHMKIILFAYE